MKKICRILPILFLIFSFSCDKKTFMSIEEIPFPAEAKSGTIDGGYEVELDAATNAIFADLKENHSTVNENILFLPPESDPLKIFAFYEPKMTEKGFVKDSSVPPQGKNYQINVWRKNGESVVVAVIDAGKNADGKTNKFLAIFLAEK